MSPSKSTVTRSSLLGPILPDEMVWSYFARLIVRFTTLTFDGLASLLGGELPSWSKSFPTRLGNLANAFKYAGAPDVTALVIGHTAFPFALPEITAHDAERLAATLAYYPHPTGAPDHLVLPGSFKLRACPACAAEDEGKYGVKYWHRCHQVPSLRVCCTHGTALHETDVDAGTKNPVPAGLAVVDLLPMEVGDAHIQGILSRAYASLAAGPANASGDQVRCELGETLRRHGLYHNRQVNSILTDKLRHCIDQKVLAQVGIEDHEVGLRAWCQVPRMALVLSVLGESFDDFITRAASVVPPALWIARGDKAAESERRMAEKVRQLAPDVVKHLRETRSQRISPWAIAKELNLVLGAGFTSNWSYKSMVKEVLQEFAERQEQFEERALERERQNPAALPAYINLMDGASSLGIGKSVQLD